MRKKIIALTLCIVVVMGALCLTGCSKEEKFIGNWISNTCEKDGAEIPTKQLWVEIAINIHEDGSANTIILGIPSVGTWEYNDETKTINVTTDTFEDFEVIEEDGSLYFDFSDTKVKLDRVEE